MIQFQVTHVDGRVGPLISDAPVTTDNIDETIEMVVWLSKQPKPYVTVVMDLPDGGHALSRVSLAALKTWLSKVEVVLGGED